MDVTREQVIAYRVAAQGLHRTGRAVGRLAILDIGVQDSGATAARLAFDARLPGTPPADGIGPDKPLALTWSLRGAPHVHRRSDLDSLAAALWPLSEADAAGRLNETGPSIAKAGISALEQYRVAVEGMRTVVTKAMGKGAASTAVTKRIPEVMRRDCRACKARHISDSAMRPAALAAGLEIEPDTSPPVLLPRRGAQVATGVDIDALQDLIRAYLALLGPATPAEVAGYLDAGRGALVQVWPDDVTEVRIEGRKTWLPARRAKDLKTAPAPELVRLLGPFDPYLQARDRALIVPDKSVHKALWPVLGRPGAVLSAGDVVGTWRAKLAGARLTVTVSPFVPFAPRVWADIEVEAARVAAVRGATDVTLVRANN